MNGWEPTFESFVKPILKQVCSGWHQKEIELWSLLSSMYAVVCSFYKSHQHCDAKIVNKIPIYMYRFEPTFESLVKPIQKQVCSGWYQKEIEVWSLLSSMYAVVCSYCKSHQHCDAKIVKNFPYI